MIIAFDKALNLNHQSNTSSKVARVFECNGAENHVTPWPKRADSHSCLKFINGFTGLHT